MRLRSLRRKTCGAGGRQQFFQLPRLFHGGAAAGLRDSVVTPALVVMLRIRPFFQFLNEPLLEKPLDSAVQRAGAKPDVTAGALLDFPHDGVAVPLTIGECNEDMKRVSGKTEGPHTIGLYHISL